MEIKDYEQNVCANIRYLRKIKGLSRSAMAHRIGVTVKSLDSLEAGLIPPRCSVQVAYHIYHAFGISPGVLMQTDLESEDDNIPVL